MVSTAPSSTLKLPPEMFASPLNPSAMAATSPWTSVLRRLARGLVSLSPSNHKPAAPRPVALTLAPSRLT
ncbi:Uncharacterised protein [Bordetella pertussis]|nr:Uncharacterised protein [Bordetella pertussis]CFP63473.1 Uncharacterised protein [Bordetella pertussis]CPK55224.1 Uncharacterised protein [Bordetella pertussis]